MTLKIKFLCVAKSPEHIRTMESEYMAHLLDTLGGEWGLIEAREATNPVRWMDAKNKALNGLVSKKLLDPKEAQECVVVVYNHV